MIVIGNIHRTKTFQSSYIYRLNKRKWGSTTPWYTLRDHVRVESCLFFCDDPLMVKLAQTYPYIPYRASYESEEVNVKKIG